MMSQTQLQPLEPPHQSARRVVLAPERKRISRIWLEKGIILCSLGRYTEALPCLDQALTLDAGNAPAWYNKGLTLYRLHRHEEALIAYDRSLALELDKAVVWGGTGRSVQVEVQAEASAC